MRRSLAPYRPTALSPEPASGSDADMAPPLRIGRLIRWAVSALSVVVFATFVTTRRVALETSFERLGHPGWSWIPIAIALESASMVTFARMQRRLLSTGGSDR